ncbi:hypothetical protein OKW35_000893 [Paraburkholderia sp. MM5477-R1]
MATGDMDGEGSIPGPCLSEAEVRRFLAAFAIQMCLFPGWRSAEALPSIGRKSRSDSGIQTSEPRCSKKMTRVYVPLGS